MLRVQSAMTEPLIVKDCHARKRLSIRARRLPLTQSWEANLIWYDASDQTVEARDHLAKDGEGQARERISRHVAAKTKPAAVGLRADCHCPVRGVESGRRARAFSASKPSARPRH